MLGDRSAITSLEGFARSSVYVDERLPAIEALGDLRDRNAIYMLPDMIGPAEPQPSVRLVAAAALGKVGRYDPRAYEFCVRIAQDPMGALRQLAAGRVRQARGGVQGRADGRAGAGPPWQCRRCGRAAAGPQESRWSGPRRRRQKHPDAPGRPAGPQRPAAAPRCARGTQARQSAGQAFGARHADSASGHQASAADCQIPAAGHEAGACGKTAASDQARAARGKTAAGDQARAACDACGQAAARNQTRSARAHDQTGVPDPGARLGPGWAAKGAEALYLRREGLKFPWFVVVEFA